MNEPSVEQVPSLEQVLAFNEEVAALVATGLPLDLGFDGSPHAIASRLQQIDQVLSLRVARGETIKQAIEKECEIPSAYQRVLLTYVRSDDPTIALDLMSTPASSHQHFAMGFGQSLIYPMIVFLLTYVAFVMLCAFTAPTIENIYRESVAEPQASLSFLRLCRDWMPVWGPLVPLLIAAIFLAWRFRPSRWKIWIPGETDYARTNGTAHYARRLAQLSRDGMPLNQAVDLVKPLAGDPPLERSATSTELSLLQWALGESIDVETRPTVLRFVAETYRQKANRQARYWRLLLPSLLGLFFAGVLVLGYGLSLFLPIVQLLKDVASPLGAS